jgi:hypothetical protein
MMWSEELSWSLISHWPCLYSDTVIRFTTPCGCQLLQLTVTGTMVPTFSLQCTIITLFNCESHKTHRFNTWEKRSFLTSQQLVHTGWAKSRYTVYYILYTYFWPTLYINHWALKGNWEYILKNTTSCKSAPQESISKQNKISAVSTSLGPTTHYYTAICLWIMMAGGHSQVFALPGPVFWLDSTSWISPRSTSVV